MAGIYLGIAIIAFCYAAVCVRGLKETLHDDDMRRSDYWWKRFWIAMGVSFFFALSVLYSLIKHGRA